MESVSAFSIYKENDNKSKTQNKKKVKKLACAKGKINKANKSLTKKNKKTNKNISNNVNNHNDNNTSREIEDSDVTALVEELMDPNKKLNDKQKKKKQKLEDYLIKQLEEDDINDDEEDSFDSEEEECDEEFSDEYTIYTTGATGTSYTTTGSTSFSSESSITDEQDEQAAEQLAKTILNQRGVKRKSDTQINKASASKNLKDSQTVNGTNKTNKSNESIRMKPTILNSNKEIVAAESSTVQTTKNRTSPNTSTNATKNSQTAKLNPRRSCPAIPNANAVQSNRATAGTSGVTCPRPNVKKGASKQIERKATVKLEPLSPVDNVIQMNSIEEGKRVFKWLLNPIKIEEFFSKYWENGACLIKRPNNRNYYQHLLSFKDFDQILLKNHVEYTKHLDITSYKNGQRLTMNLEGRALPPTVWDHYDQGCSVRLLNPQIFLSSLGSLNATLQEYFHCMVGTNIYLTPPNSQGFAPHYDDIEAFVLQIEGRKRWKLYKPRNASELLPRYSSKNLDQKDIGDPIIEEILEPGDLLYFPRGTIHQASTMPGHHSLHVTLSVYQRQSYGDLFEKMLPLILKKSFESQLDLRKGLPLNIWRNAGIVFSEIDTKERSDIQKKVKQLLNKIIRELPLADIVDEAVDQLAKKFQHEALPPDIVCSERKRTIFGSQSITNESGECLCDYDIDERTNIRLLRAHIVRLIKEEDEEDNTIDKFRLYYYLDNSKEYCQHDLNFMEIEPSQAAGVEVLIKSYPAYIGVSELPMTDSDSKIQLATALWEKGLLMMEKPFV